MKKAVVFACMASVFLSGCGAGGTASQTADSSAQAVASELNKAEWAAVSTDAEAFHLNGGTDSADFSYVMEHMDTVSLDRLIAFALAADGGPSEGACEELRSRFLESPHTVLAYLMLMGEQTAADGQTPAAELVCEQIASADAAWHDGSEEFAKVMETCKAEYPDGPAAELLSKMEAAHEASLERNK